MKPAKGRTLIVAEISANHGQSISRAALLIKKAKECGADAVKFQTYTPDSLTIDVDNRFFRIKHPEWGGQTLYELYKKASMPWKWLKKLKKISREEGLEFFATAFDREAVDFLEGLSVPAHKISSFELVDLGLIEYAARTGKPLILSCGMAEMREIKEAVNTARRAGSGSISLLKCVSSYPADPKTMNLRTIPHMRKTFRCSVGLSDHTLGIAVPVAAVALGAEIIEKHFTLSRKIKTPDSFFSLEPRELKELVRSVRAAEGALGNVHYGFTREETPSRSFRRSLFAVEDIRKGEKITSENIRSIRPGYGMEPRYYKSLLGKRAQKYIKRGTPLRRGMIK